MKETLLNFWKNTLRPPLEKIWREFYAFISTMFFIRNFAMMVGAIAFFLLLTAWWLRCYTNHGESLQVHNYIGLSLDEAKDKAKTRKLRIEVVDSRWMEGMEPNIVLEQDPVPFSRVKEKRTIYLTITDSDRKLLTLPPLVGNYDYDQYKKKLKLKGLKASIRDRVVDNKQAPNTILEVYYQDERVSEDEIKEGFKVPQGGMLEFVITERGVTYIEMPNLIDLTYAEAEFMVKSIGLTVGRVLPDATVVDRNSAKVYRTDPKYGPGKTLQLGQSIDMWITEADPLIRE